MGSKEFVNPPSGKTELLGKSIKTLHDEIAHIIDVTYGRCGDDRFDALPDIFYRIQVGAVRGEENKLYPQPLSFLHHFLCLMAAIVIQDDIEQIKQFLEGSEALEFRALVVEEKYDWIETVPRLREDRADEVQIS